MPLSPSRRIAYDVLRRVELGRGFAPDLLRSSAAALLSDADQSLAMELVMGTLRRRAELDGWISRLSGKAVNSFDPEIATILRLGIYQIRWLQRIPKRAAVNESVELAKAARKRSAAGLVNAVLRKCEAPSSTDGIEDDSLRLALPEWLHARWAGKFGVEAANALAGLSLAAPRVVIRIARGEIEQVRSQLLDEGTVLKPASYARQAFIVEHGKITRSPLWRDGTVVIQDEASQLVASLVNPQAGHRVLDLCAAPGVKTVQIAADLGRGLLVACDRSARRLDSMFDFAQHSLPAPVRCYRVQLDAGGSLPFGVQFDRILLDAPCSGTGTLARNPEIKWRLRLDDIERLAELQRLMLGRALEALAVGGRLVYATCSLEPEENEQVVEQALAGTRGFRCLGRTEMVLEWPALESLFDARGYFRTRPDLHGTDGFFAAVIERGRFATGV
jgi:16S rRNA (cytosine967-C5)-methyltransferase